MRKERKHYTGEEKVGILRRHLLDKVPVSDLCDELGLQPTVFYRWQKEFFENGAAASLARAARTIKPNSNGSSSWRRRSSQRRGVAELMAEHIALKKVLGSSLTKCGCRTTCATGGGFRPCWSEKTEIGAGRFIHWLGVRASKILRLARALWARQ